MNRGIKEALGALSAAVGVGMLIYGAVSVIPPPWGFVTVGVFILVGAIWFGRS